MNYQMVRWLKKGTSLLLLAMVLACGESSDPRIPATNTKREKQTSIENFSSSSTLTVGDTITFQILTKSDSITIDSTAVLLNGAEVSITNDFVSIATGQTGLGRQVLNVEVFYGGEVDKHAFTLEFLSDIKPMEYGYERVTFYPHDPEAYIQGLFFHEGFLYENTGRNGHSSLRKVDLQTGRILEQNFLPDKYFGEGITLWNDQIIQLTWHANEGFVYTLEGFEQIKTFNYPTEGWGITTLDDELVMSDGTENLYFLDPESLTETRRIKVYDDLGPVKNLNELEFINGEIYANIYTTDYLATIDPNTGKVLSKIDLTGLMNARTDRKPPPEVLNGIAYDATTQRLFVTGKYWPRLYEIRLVEKRSS